MVKDWNIDVGVESISKALVREMPVHYYNKIKDGVVGAVSSGLHGVHTAMDNLANALIDYGKGTIARGSGRMRAGFGDWKDDPVESVIATMLTAMPVTGMFIGVVVGTWNEEMGEEIYNISAMGLAVEVLDFISFTMLPEEAKEMFDEVSIIPIKKFVDCTWTQCHSWLAGYKEETGEAPPQTENIEYTSETISFKDIIIVAWKGLNFIRKLVKGATSQDIKVISRIMSDLTGCARCFRQSHKTIQCNEVTTIGGRRLE